MYSLFVELLQISVGTRDSFSRVPSALEWERIFDEAQRQAVAGIMLAGMERMPDEQRPNKVLLLQWIGI